MILQFRKRATTGSRKDGTVPGGGQLRERRDGFRIVSLVMSINYLRIGHQNDDDRGKGPGRVQTPSRGRSS